MGILRKFRSRDEKSKKLVVGGFRYVETIGSVKISDVNGYFSHNASKDSVVGQFLSLAIENAEKGDEKAKDWLAAYAVCTYNVLGVVPDEQFLGEMSDAAQACMNRHGSLYGMKPEMTKEEDDAVLQDVKETVEMEQELKEAVEKES